MCHQPEIMLSWEGHPTRSFEVIAQQTSTIMEVENDFMEIGIFRIHDSRRKIFQGRVFMPTTFAKSLRTKKKHTIVIALVCRRFLIFNIKNFNLVNSFWVFNFQ